MDEGDDQMFKLPAYHTPDFSQPVFETSPDALRQPAPMDGVAPENFHAMSIYPEYFKVSGQWLLAEESRMDCVPVLTETGIEVVEFRNIKKGMSVFIGRSEDASEGIYVHTRAFEQQKDVEQAFAFRTGRSRETAYTRDYDALYDLLRYERENGLILWVMGPACAFDADARAAFSSLIADGYVNGLMAGNALATHDLEAGLLHTALGQDIYTQESMPNGHYNHLDTINKVRACGGIRQFIEAYHINDGIMRGIMNNNIPYVLAGSIRDDGPLPPVYGNVYEAQDQMRALVRRATTIICMASTLHTIATGNMTPSYRKKDGVLRPLYFYSVDISEFSVNKLRDRGSLAVRTFVTNAQDFVVNVKKGLDAGKDGVRR